MPISDRDVGECTGDYARTGKGARAAGSTFS
jgi:hypothetical protein